jgi:REP element-mobilizing transposase RayT
MKTEEANNRSAGVPPAVAGASRPRFGTVTIRDRGHLPHWEKDSATYFVTFRLADSLPRSVLQTIESEREAIVKTAAQAGRELSPDEHRKLQRLSTVKIERYLDSGAGACRLKEPAIASIVASTLRHFDDSRYRLLAWCIMPNHVHVVARLFPGQALSSVVHSWKSFTAKKCNASLGMKGSFWQREYYDHLIRDEDDLERVVGYLADNPAEAGLHDWPWVWLWGQDAPTTAAEDGGAT